MIDLDALKAELEAAGFGYCYRPDDNDVLEIDGGIIRVFGDGKAFISSGHFLYSFHHGPIPIIARHVAPVVTPEPPAEVRDVLAEALKVYYGIPADERAPEADGIADAGLAALRDKGFAVVRTADVEAVTRYLDSQRDIWDERASRACDALEEAIR